MNGTVLGMDARTDDRLVTPLCAVLVVRGLDDKGIERDFVMRVGNVRNADAIGMHATALARYLKAVTQ